MVNRWLGQRAGAVLCDRRVHRIFDGRLRDDQTPSQPSGTRSATPDGDQPFRGSCRRSWWASSRWRSSPRAPGWSSGVPGPGVHVDPAQPRISGRGGDSRDVPYRAARTGEVRRHRVFVFVNSVDLAVLEALRYGRGLRADELVAVHFMVDAAYAAQLRKGGTTSISRLRCGWWTARTGGSLGPRRCWSPRPATNGEHQRDGVLPRRTLRRSSAGCCMTAAPRRSLVRSASSRTRRRRSSPTTWNRGSRRRIPTVSSIGSRANSTRSKRGPPRRTSGRGLRTSEAAAVGDHGSGSDPGQRATVEGRVSEVEDVARGRRTLRQVVVGDNSGEIRVTFRPGHGGADIQPGQLVRITGKARQTGNRPVRWSTRRITSSRTPRRPSNPEGRRGKPAKRRVVGTASRPNGPACSDWQAWWWWCLCQASRSPPMATSH